MSTKPVSASWAHAFSSPPSVTVSIDALVQAAFKNLDSNGDRAVSRAEVLAKLGPAAKSPLVTLMVGQVVKSLDASGDGLVSTAELTAFLNRADANRDGSLSAGEIHTAGVGLVGVLGMIGLQPPGG
ncbi:MAG: hypothetical protein ACKOJ7_07045 [Betaproteobacteria bacterium]